MFCLCQEGTDHRRLCDLCAIEFPATVAVVTVTLFLDKVTATDRIGDSLCVGDLAVAATMPTVTRFDVIFHQQ